MPICATAPGQALLGSRSPGRLVGASTALRSVHRTGDGDNASYYWQVFGPSSKDWEGPPTVVAVVAEENGRPPHWFGDEWSDGVRAGWRGRSIV